MASSSENGGGGAAPSSSYAWCLAQKGDDAGASSAVGGRLVQIVGRKRCSASIADNSNDGPLVERERISHSVDDGWQTWNAITAPASFPILQQLWKSCCFERRTTIGAFSMMGRFLRPLSWEFQGVQSCFLM